MQLTNKRTTPIQILHKLDKLLRTLGPKFRCTVPSHHARVPTKQRRQRIDVLLLLMELHRLVSISISAAPIPAPQESLPRTQTHLYISHEIDARAFNLHGQVGVHALPMCVEEVVGEAWFLVEEDHDAEVGLLV
jgi:hypothetical protein